MPIVVRYTCAELQHVLPEAPVDSRKFSSVGQVAQRVQVAPSTLRFWELRGEIPVAQRIGLRSIRGWDEDSVAVIAAKAEQRRAAVAAAKAAA